MSRIGTMCPLGLSFCVVLSVIKYNCTFNCTGENANSFMALLVILMMNIQHVSQ